MNKKLLWVLFIGLTLGFTFISLYNGYNFYKILFGTSMAILISSVFEIARVTCLFRFVQSKSNFRIFPIFLYIIIAFVCAFAAINSFTSEVIYKNRQSEKELRKQIQIIKKTYNKNIEKKIEIIDKDIIYVERKIAAFPGRKYWETRLSQIMTNRDKITKERDAFMKTDPEDPINWIRTNAAKLDLELGEISNESEEVISIIQALKDLWGMEKISAQKIMGLIVTIVVEFSILLLAFLSHFTKKPEIEIDFDEKELTKTLYEQFDKSDVDKFIAINKEYLRDNGKIIPLNKITEKLRPIKKYIENLHQENLKKMI